MNSLGRTGGADPVSPPHSEASSVTLPGTEQWTQFAKDGRAFRISLARPKGPAPKNGYALIVVLDPDTAFATLADFVRNHEKGIGPVAVAGVGYRSDEDIRQRTYDLTPETDPASLPESLEPGGWGPTGGAEAFHAFLEEQVKPAVSEKLPVSKSRQALFGHSLGGLFVLHVLFNHAEAYDTYIAGSPSIWWGEKQILKQLPTFEASQRQNRANKRLLMTVGELEDRFNTESERYARERGIDRANLEDRIKRNRMPGNAVALANELVSAQLPNVETQFVLFPGETHISGIPGYLARGARWTMMGWFD